MKPAVLAFLFAGLMVVMPMACSSPSGEVVNDCPPCPNNTECQDGDCGCPPDKHDMGSWCLSKADNLFVAASLDCPCFDVVGLYLGVIDPITDPNGPSGNVGTSTYWLSGRGNILSSGMSSFDYYAKPDGDSIAIYAAILPDTPGLSFYCRVNAEQRCVANIFGKFHGPDTIKAEVVWRSCIDNKGNYSGYTETDLLTFVRWR